MFMFILFIRAITLMTFSPLFCRLDFEIAYTVLAIDQNHSFVAPTSRKKLHPWSPYKKFLRIPMYTKTA